ncbi:MAG TPA: Rieske (2Fe-2S) protein [Devosia sp.]|nr:Rieske (2Fe-2S) protein [Devosia sp.]
MSWIPLALSRDVPPGTTRAVILDGQELVLWRGEAGTIQVWEDRCPHRGMRLSFGFVRGDSLNCLYHGWQYGAGSRCMRIPAHPDLEVPPSIRATALEASESGGFILIDRGETMPPPAIPAETPIASLAIDAESGTLLQLCGAKLLAGADVFETRLDGIALTLGWHAVRSGHLMLHAVARDAGAESRALLALHDLRASAERKAA